MFVVKLNRESAGFDFLPFPSESGARRFYEGSLTRVRSGEYVSIALLDVEAENEGEAIRLVGAGGGSVLEREVRVAPRDEVQEAIDRMQDDT